MMGLDSIRVKIAEFLSAPLFGVDVDAWLFIHFFSGVILFLFLGYFIKKSQYKKKLAIFFSLIVFWEIFELFAVGFGSSFFTKESAINIFYDVGMGSLGGFIALKYFQK